MAGAIGRNQRAVSDRGNRQHLTAWDKKMCGQVAWALLAHTGLPDFLCDQQNGKPRHDSILPLLPFGRHGRPVYWYCPPL